MCVVCQQLRQTTTFVDGSGLSSLKAKAKKENISSKWCWPCYDKCQPYQKHNLDTLQRRTSSTNRRMEVLLPAGGAIVCRCRLSAWNQYTNRLLIVTINDLATSSTEKSNSLITNFARLFFFFHSFVWVILLFLGAKDSFFCLSCESWDLRVLKRLQQHEAPRKVFTLYFIVCMAFQIGTRSLFWNERCFFC